MNRYQLFKSLLAGKGVTLKEYAAKLGKSTTTIWMVLHGRLTSRPVASQVCQDFPELSTKFPFSYLNQEIT